MKGRSYGSIKNGATGLFNGTNKSYSTLNIWHFKISPIIIAFDITTKYALVGISIIPNIPKISIGLPNVSFYIFDWFSKLSCITSHVFIFEDLNLLSKKLHFHKSKP